MDVRLDRSRAQRLIGQPELLDPLLELDRAGLEAADVAGEDALGSRLDAEQLAHAPAGRRDVGGRQAPAEPLLPVVEDLARRPDADRVVDHGRAADAHPLQHLEREVACQLDGAVAIQRHQHLRLVLGELRRVDMAPALEHDDVLARLGEPVGEQRAGGAAADDRDVGRRARPT